MRISDCSSDVCSSDLQVGVAPRAHGRAASEVLVAEVQPADKGHVAVRNQYLAVVAEVQLEAVHGPLGGAEGAHHHAGGTQLGNEEMRQPIAADLVVEHVDPEAVSGAPRETRLEVAAEIVIAQNVDLQQKGERKSK